MAHALDLGHTGAHECESCAARERAQNGSWGRARAVVTGWLSRVNGTPVNDIGRYDLGGIRRLAEA